MTVIEAAPVSTDEIAGRIRENVWTLVRAGKLDAAMVLLESIVEDFDQAWLREMRQSVGLPTPPALLALPAPPAPEVATATAVDESGELGPQDVDPVTPDTSPTGVKVYQLVAGPGGRRVRVPRNTAKEHTKAS